MEKLNPVTALLMAERFGHDSLIALAPRLKTAFASWYGNGHINEDDPHTVILRVHLTDGVLFHHGTRYEIDFSEG